MTNRNRPPPRRRTGPRRTGRNVWVNDLVSAALTVDAIALIDLLSTAADFMLFDTTIVRIVQSHMAISGRHDNTNGVRAAAVAYFVGPALLDADDIDRIMVSSIGSPWMWHRMNSAVFGNTAAGDFTFLMNSDSALRIGAKRRFKENDSTLWLAVENQTAAGDTNLRVDGFVRTLIHIP